MKEMRKSKLTESQKSTLTKIILVVSILIFCGVGFLIGFSQPTNPLNEEGITECKEIAQYVHISGATEVQGYEIRDNDGIITVKKDGYSGIIEASMQNGNEFSFNYRNNDKVINGMIGILVAETAYVIVYLILAFGPFE